MRTRITLIAMALALTGAARAATVLFEDNFETDSSANWTALNGSSSGTPDFTVDWAFDYSNTGYTSNGVAFKIPVAPGSAGTTRGVKVTVNKLDEVAEAAAVNLYPKDKTFTGNYALRFDMWINYNGGAYGGTGSTEFGIFGVNHTGAQVNWSPPSASASAVPTSDGLWFAVTGEAGANRDYRYYEGDPVGAPLEYTAASGGFLDRDNDGTIEQEALSTTATDYPLDVIYQRPPQETRGVPGKKWVQVEVRQQSGIVTWLLDGYVISEKVNGSLWTNGNIMIGIMDNFDSIASPKEDNFVIFDNLRVVDLASDPAPPRLTLQATVTTASEPSTGGEFTLTRSGNTATALNVKLGFRGSATPGLDFETIPLTTNLAAGATTLQIPITVTDDQLAEPAEQIKMYLVGNPGEYEVFAPMIGAVELADDNDLTTVDVTAVDAYAYEGIPSDIGRFRISRVGDISGELAVNFSVSGTALVGTDYNSIGSMATLPADSEFVDVNVVSIDQTEVNGDRTVIIELAAGNNYALGSATNASITVRDDDGLPAGTLVFSDNFDTDTSASWVVSEANPESSRATFNFDYSTVGIPAAPQATNGTTRGLKLEANIGEPTFTGISVSPSDQGFQGDYRLSFDMWINYNGPLPEGGSGSTLAFSAGIGASGAAPQFPGTSVEGVLFSVTGDGGSGTDWRAYVDTGAPIPIASGVYAAGTNTTAMNNTDPYYAPFGLAFAPEAQLALFPDQSGAVSTGAPGMAWHEVWIEKRGTNVSWFVDNLRIATIPLTNKEISTNIFVGFFDINTTQTGNQELSFGLVDSLKVEMLESQPPTDVVITSIRLAAPNIEIQFTAEGSLTTFVVEGSGVVDGPYAAESNVQISQDGTTRTATLPMTSDDRFFRVRAQ